MKRIPCLAACLVALAASLALLAVPARAATSQKASGNLQVQMSFDIDEFYLAANPHFYVYLEETGTDQAPAHYFVKTEYNKKTQAATATVKTPLVGKYAVKYYGAMPRQEDACDAAAKASATIPSERPDLFKELSIGVGVSGSDYAGGFMVLKKAPTTLTIGASGATLSIVSTHHTRRETYIPGAFISISGIDTTSSLFNVDLYVSDKNGNALTKIRTEGTTKATTAAKGYPRHFDGILAPAPGTYYFLVKERVNESLFRAPDPVLYALSVGYQDDRMVPKKVTMKQGKALRSISMVGSDPIKISITDNRASDASYYVYGTFDKSYPYEQEKADGTWPGTATKLVQKGNTFTGTVSPVRNKWSTYVIVKKTKNGINRGDTIYLPVNAVPFSNSTVTVWRLRAGATFTSLYSPKKPATPSFTKAIAGKGLVTLRWGKKTDCDCYEIQYSTNASFKSPVWTSRIYSSKTTTRTIRKLLRGRTYYFRIRSYKKPNPTSKVYSSWSAKKKLYVK